MTFLNPVILWGLAAVSIPILIHIFNLKRTKKVEFSTLMFLKEIQQSKYKKIKLRQLLILLARIAFIILLVMMFAKPFDTGFLGTPFNKAKSSVLIIFDDSFSMQSRDKNGSDFENGKRKIYEIIDALGNNDEIYFALASSINEPRSFIPVRDISKLKDTIQQLKTSEISRNINDIKFYADAILEGASNSIQEVYFVTDGQQSAFNSQLALSSQNNNNLHWNIILTGSRKANNISLDTLNIVTKIFEKNRPVKIRISVNNQNNFNSLNKSLVLNMGTNHEEKVIDVPANSIIDAEFIVKPEHTGYISGSAELVQNDISDDEISGDNKQNFVFFIPEKVNILIAANQLSDAEYLKIVLNTSKEITPGTDITTAFNIKEINSASLSNEDLTKFNSVIIINKPAFNELEAEKLNNYIESGGGVILYPGALTDISNYNNILMNKLDIPYINNKFNSSAVKFDKVDLMHPVFEGIFKNSGDNQSRQVESPEITQGYSPGTGKNSFSIINLTNGTNFMTESTKGKGKMIIFAVPPDLSWSDFPKQNIFSPVTIRTILYTSNLNGIAPAIAGKDYFIEPAAFNISGDSLKFQSENKDGNINNLFLKENTGMINTGNMFRTNSVYTISGNNSGTMEVPVNFDKKESRTERMSPNEIKKLFNDKLKIEANVIENSRPLTASISANRTGSDLWQYFLAGAILFFIIEYILSRSIMQKKANKSINQH